MGHAALQRKVHYPLACLPSSYPHYPLQGVQGVRLQGDGNGEKMPYPCTATQPCTPITPQGGTGLRSSTGGTYAVGDKTPLLV